LASTTAVTGASAAIDKNLFYDQTLPALFAQMEGDRANVLTIIDAATVKLDSVFPLTELLSLTEQYRTAGSIPGAVASVTAAAGQAKGCNQTKLTLVRAAKLTQQRITPQLLATATPCPPS
jgi:hypothetical protein